MVAQSPNEDEFMADLHGNRHPQFTLVRQAFESLVG